MSAYTIDKVSRWVSLLSGERTVPIATSPRHVVYQRDKLTLYRYQRDTPPQHEVPILLVYSLINRPSILDLQPRRSVVAHLLQRGFDVYLLDWGIPDGLDRFNGMDVHINLLLRTAVRKVCEHSNQPQVTLFGYCMGGTMAAIYTALHPQRVKNLLLLGAPFNFRSDELLYRWGTNENTFQPQRVVDVSGGNAPTWAFEGFTLLKIHDKLARLKDLYERQDNSDFVESHLAMEQWVGDNIPMPGAIYVEFITQCFQRNALIDGQMRVGDKRVNLEDIQCPTLIIAGSSDHLVPPETATPIARKVKTAETILFPSGHIGLSVSSASHRKLWPQACDWLAQHSL